MTPPLAFLNVEEMHWRCDLGLPNQRRWLNHRYIGDEHRRTFSLRRAHSITNDSLEDLRSQISDLKRGEFCVSRMEHGFADELQA